MNDATMRKCSFITFICKDGKHLEKMVNSFECKLSVQRHVSGRHERMSPAVKGFRGLAVRSSYELEVERLRACYKSSIKFGVVFIWLHLDGTRLLEGSSGSCSSNVSHPS